MAKFITSLAVIMMTRDYIDGNDNELIKEISKMKIKMHTLSNRLSFLIIFPIFIFFGYKVYVDAASDVMRIFGLCALAAMLVFFTWLFVFRMCIYDYAIFKEDEIELHTPFKMKRLYKYNEVIGCLGVYTSVTETKKYLMFTGKEHNSVVTHVDTSKRGNIALVNKLQVVYVPASEDIIKFLKQKDDLQWYNFN